MYNFLRKKHGHVWSCHTLEVDLVYPFVTHLVFFLHLHILHYLTEEIKRWTNSCGGFHTPGFLSSFAYLPLFSRRNKEKNQFLCCICYDINIYTTLFRGRNKDKNQFLWWTSNYINVCTTLFNGRTNYFPYLTLLPK